MHNRQQRQLLESLHPDKVYKTYGCLYSEQRLEVIGAFLKYNRPLDAEELWLQMANSGRKISLSCVRSSLNWLVNQKLAAISKPTNGRSCYCL
ncbi:MAG: hypothetical protein AAGC88_08705 [Bacteroidota bacterium]